MDLLHFIGEVEGALRLFIAFGLGRGDHPGIHLPEFRSLTVDGLLEVVRGAFDAF